jgi:uncharacterized protein with PQ loop repeat
MPISLISFFSWLALICYTVCFIPQVIKNYRLKSAAGWSDFFILMYLAGYVGLIYYTFCINFPHAYKVMVPIQTLLMLIIAGQRFYYDQVHQNKTFVTLFILMILLTCGILPFAQYYPTLIGNSCGWISLFFFCLFPTPQIIKIFKEKSLKGFSIGFLTIFTFASLSELAVACTGALPVQTIFMISKNLLTSTIFYIQFLLYKK